MASEIARPKIIVLGNEKGGVGKTTVALHLIVDMLYHGFRVSSVDVDARQRSLSRYLENRKRFIMEHGVSVPLPHHFIVNQSTLDSKKTAREDDAKRLVGCLEKARERSDFIVVDCPGNDIFLSRLAHSFADMVITPINDSFVDMDVIAKVDPATHNPDKHGVYAEVIWEAKLARAQRDQGEIAWIILRNRLSAIDAKNKQQMTEALNKVRKRSGSVIIPGLSERVIYRELFLQGMTLLDMFRNLPGVDAKLSHVSARRELRQLLEALNLYTSPPATDMPAKPESPPKS